MGQGRVCAGFVNIFAYATELAPTNRPLAFAVTPLGGLDDVLRTSAVDPGGFCFGVGDHLWSPGTRRAGMPTQHGFGA